MWTSILIKRNQYLENIRRFYESNLIKVLTGVRRCGKSVLLNQIKEELIRKKLEKIILFRLILKMLNFLRLKALIN